ncbi:hypothetical protein N2152v2_006816 [Parachlorella kessleri]
MLVRAPGMTQRSLQTGSAAEQWGGDSSAALSFSSPGAQQQSSQPEAQAQPQSSPTAVASTRLVQGSPRFPGSPEAALPASGSQTSRGRSGKADRTELHLAAWQGRVVDVCHLVGCGYDVNAVDSGGCTPLHLACKAGYAKLDILFRQDAAQQLETVQALLRLGASVHSRTVDGRTALHFAARTGCSQTIKLLLAAGADLDGHDSQGWTAAHFAAYRAHAEALQELLVAGADPLQQTAASGDPLLSCKTPRGLLEARPAGQKGLEGREVCLQLLLAAEDELSLSLGTQVRQLQLQLLTVQSKLHERLLAAEQSSSRPASGKALPTKQTYLEGALNDPFDLSMCQPGQQLWQPQHDAQLLRAQEAAKDVESGDSEPPDQLVQEVAEAAMLHGQAVEQDSDMSWLAQQLQLLSLERDAALAELLSLRSLLQQARHERNTAWAEAAAASQQLRQALAAQQRRQQQLGSSLSGSAAESVEQGLGLQLQRMQQECLAAQEKIAALKSSSSALGQEVRQTQEIDYCQVDGR